jgi:hypothetical protein
MMARMAGMMAAVQRRESAPAFGAPSTCPYYPGTAAVVTSPVLALAATTTAQQPLTAQAYKPLSARTRVLLSPTRTHAGRGPPAVA